MTTGSSNQNLFVGVPSATASGGLTSGGGGTVVSPANQAATPILLTYPDGSTVLAIFKDATSPVPAGYYTSNNVYVPGPPPAGWTSPTAKDVDLIGRNCVFDSTTDAYLGTVITEVVTDSTTAGALPTYQFVFLKADGTVQRPYAALGSHRQDQCGDNSIQPVEMHEVIDAKTAVDFVRWINPATGLGVYDRNVNGASYTVVAPANVSLGPSQPHSREVWNVPGSVAPGTHFYRVVNELGAVSWENLDGTPYTFLGTEAPGPWQASSNPAVNVWWPDAANYPVNGLAWYDSSTRALLGLRLMDGGIPVFVPSTANVYAGVAPQARREPYYDLGTLLNVVKVTEPTGLVRWENTAGATYTSTEKCAKDDSHVGTSAAFSVSY